ncbi:NADP-specific glutamate dehydrogenase [Halioxenophilus aromaticivorans]|uniref:Glutamate dehydrogenase n=1 Tax=Halioxenophilus aromaticivorans TaxID=1306992 RepID=A0AAV3U717_9ALTE
MSKNNIQKTTQWLEDRNPNQPEFIQAVKEVFGDIEPLVEADQDILAEAVLQRLSEPDRIISFRVTWEDDAGQVHVNRGYRVQYCGALGPYKGGIRFHPSVNESILKFLGFEQTFKNALTNIPLGGAKGGSDFNPKGRSDREIMRFCQAFMNELYRHIGENTDIPAGDINVGAKEIGYLFGQYRRLKNRFSGALTGKGIEFGGSFLRPEATGFGLIFFVKDMLDRHDQALEDKTVAISGSGNVALHAALKATENGARVTTLSNSEGCLYVEQGLSTEAIKQLIDTTGRVDLASVAEDVNGQWQEDAKPWQYPCDIALPCATQNELDEDDAKALVDNGCQFLAEGANMPCTNDAVATLNEAQIPNAPGKASNAGGVALSGLEMAQNACFNPMSYSQLDEKLRSIMKNVHQQCLDEHKHDDQWINYRQCANRAAFRRVAAGILAQGTG